MLEPLSSSVLVVEDDEIMLRTLQRQLSSLGCDATLTRNASEFLTAFHDASDRIDIAVIDIRLPGLHGDLLISWLRESEQEAIRRIPVLIATGHPADIPDEILGDFARVRVLTKPFTLQQLRQAILDLTRPETLH